MSYDINKQFRVWGHAQAFGKTPEPEENLPLETVLFLHPEPIPQAKRKPVFIPARGVPANLYATLCETQNVLYLAQTSQDLDFGACPGARTLSLPNAGILHQRAIVSASWVASGYLEPLLLAVSNGVPAVFLGMDPLDCDQAQAFGIPVLNASMDPQALAKAIHLAVEQFPWEKARQAITFTQNRPTGKAGKDRKTGEGLQLCSISDGNYLPFLLGFMANATERSSRDIVFHVLALDESVREYFARDKTYRTCVYALADLWEASELATVLDRRVGFRAFSSKPRLIERVLGATSAPVFYCDSDILFLEDPASLVEVIGGSCVVLFPHWNDAFPEARLDGLFNAGMLGVQKGAEGFLSWWGKQCLDSCAIDRNRGLVADQGFLDFVPVYFEGTRIYRAGDHNVARWNLKSLGVAWEKGLRRHPVLGSGANVKTYHAAFLDDSGFFELKYGWDQLVHFFAEQTAETPALAFNCRMQQRIYWKTLGRALKVVEGMDRLFGKRFSETAAIHFFFSGAGKKILEQVIRLLHLIRRVSRGRAGHVPPCAETSGWVERQKGIARLNQAAILSERLS